MKSRRQADRRRGSSNVYADLGYRTPDRMFIKAQLARRIADRLSERGMTESRAATLLGIPQPELSKLLRGQFREISVRRLGGFLVQL